MSDIPQIWRGYEATPHLWPDSLRWWHGPWIEEGVNVFRPLSSYLLWFETWLGIRFGFETVAKVGILLVVWVSWVCVCLAWTFLRSVPATILAALLAPTARRWLMSGTAPTYWMIWYPVHHDLLMTGLLLSALLYWARWLQSARQRDLWLTWISFIAGVLSKEFVYIFPVMAAAVIAIPDRRVTLRAALTQFVAMFASVLLFWFYRKSVLPGAYNPPPLKRIHFIRRPFLYWFPPFYGYICAGDFYMPGLGLWIFASTGLCVRFKTWISERRPAALWRWLPLCFVIGGVFLYCSTFLTLGETFWYLFEPNQFPMRLDDLILLTSTYWFLWMVFKYRRHEPTLAVFGVLLLAYIPVWTYLGWHYTIVGWFVRAALWWPLLLKLAIRDVFGQRQWALRWPKLPTQPPLSVQES